jgi:hypothetical protein
MSESEKVTDTDEKKDIFAPLAVMIAIGVVLGLIFYGGYLFLNPSGPVIEENNTIVPDKNETIIEKSKINITMIDVDECDSCNSSDYILVEVKSLATEYNFEIENIETADSESNEAKALISKYGITKLPTMVLSGDTDSLNGFETLWANIGSSESDGALVYREVYPPYLDVSSNSILGQVSVVEIFPDCGECFDVSTFVDYLESDAVAMLIVNRTELDLNSSEAQSTIAKYNITKLPTFVLSSDASVYPIIDQAWSKYGTAEPDGSYVWRNYLPPYVDLDQNGSVVGVVDMIELVDSSCTDCYNVSLHKQGLSIDPFNLFFGNVERVEANSTDGQLVISKYNITAYPTIVLSNDALLYPGFKDTWEGMGTVESDGMLVFRALDLLGVQYVNTTLLNTTNSSS